MRAGIEILYARAKFGPVALEVLQGHTGELISKYPKSEPLFAPQLVYLEDEDHYVAFQQWSILKD